MSQTEDIIRKAVKALRRQSTPIDPRDVSAGQRIYDELEDVNRKWSGKNADKLYGGRQEAGFERPEPEQLLEMREKLQDARQRSRKAIDKRLGTGQKLSDEVTSQAQKKAADRIFAEYGKGKSPEDIEKIARVAAKEDTVTKPMGPLAAMAAAGGAAAWQALPDSAKESLLSALTTSQPYLDKFASYTEAPAKAAVQAASKGESPLKAAYKAFGDTESDIEPGKEVMGRMGIPDEDRKITPSPLAFLASQAIAPSVANAPINKQDIAKESTRTMYPEITANPREIAGMAYDQAVDLSNINPAGPMLAVAGKVPGMASKASKAARAIPGMAEKAAAQTLKLNIPGQGVLDFGENTAKAMKVKSDLEAAGKIPKGLVFTSDDIPVRKINMSPEMPEVLPTKKDVEETVQMYLNAQKELGAADDPMSQYRKVLEAKGKLD